MLELRKQNNRTSAAAPGCPRLNRRMSYSLATPVGLRQSRGQKSQNVMSLEFELQKYPKEIKLKDGSKCKLRPLRKDDEKGFHAFFLGVPEAERMFIKHRVTEPRSFATGARTLTWAAICRCWP